MKRWGYILAGLFLLVVAGGGGALYLWAGSIQTVAADEVARRVAAGELTLLDVRSVKEWRQTGLPAGAVPATIHGPEGMRGFITAAKAAVGGKTDRPVALICHSGGRSTHAARALEEAGFTHVYNVREGMAGNPMDGPGWIKRGLKTEKPPAP
jgi:rhodanese-related sulfurtransferase